MTDQLPLIQPDVLIIGGGPAGLTAAAELAGRSTGHILVVDRENAAGGIPRHSDHTGYGLRDLHRVMTGPVYARHLVDRATRAGAEIRTRTMATGWADEQTLDVTSPDGRYRIRPRAIVLATGARERPRTARRIPGDRPHGVYTTGQLQNLVHLHHQPVGKRAVVVGGELVSWSAALTLREAGCTPALMVSQYPKAESYGIFNAAGRSVLRVPVATRSRVTRVIGKGRCQAERSNISTPASDAPSNATPSSSPVTGSPTTNSSGPPASPSTRAPSAPSPTPRCAPAAPASSPSATCCTRSTPPTSPHSTDSTSPSRSSTTWRAGRSRSRVCGWSRAHRSVGSPRRSCAPTTRHRPAAGSCCGRTSSSASPG